MGRGSLSQGGDDNFDDDDGQDGVHEVEVPEQQGGQDQRRWVGNDPVWPTPQMGGDHNDGYKPADFYQK